MIERLEPVGRRLGDESEAVELLLEIVHVERLVVDDEDAGPADLTASRAGLSSLSSAIARRDLLGHRHAAAGRA